MNSDTGMMTDPRSIKRANALGDMHDALQAALHAMTRFWHHVRYLRYLELGIDLIECPDNALPKQCIAWRSLRQIRHPERAKKVRPLM